MAVIHSSLTWLLSETTPDRFALLDFEEDGIWHLENKYSGKDLYLNTVKRSGRVALRRSGLLLLSSLSQRQNFEMVGACYPNTLASSPYLHGGTVDLAFEEERTASISIEAKSTCC